MPRFRYDPVVPSDGSIGELIARRGQIEGRRARDVGDAQAQAALMRGQVWGNAIGSIGDIASRGITAYTQQRQEQAVAQQQQDAKAQITRRDAALTGLFEKFPDGDIPLKELSRIYGPRDGLTLKNGLLAVAKLEAGTVDDPYEAAVHIGSGFKALKSPALQQAFWPQVQQAAVKAGLVTPEQLPAEYTDELPDMLIAWGSGKAPTEGALKLERVEVRQPDGSVTHRWVQPSAGLEVSGGAPPRETPPSVGSFEDYVTAKYGPRPTPQQIEEARKGYQPSGAGGGNPYFIPLQTGQGVVSFDTRTGEAAGRIADLKPGATAQREIANATTTATILRQVIGSIDEKSIGPLSGRYKTVEAALAGNDPQFAMFSAAVSTMQNTVIQLRTGAQMSEHEAARILNEVPNVNLPPATFVAKAKQAEKYFQEWLKNRANVAYGRTTTQEVDRMVNPGGAASSGGAGMVRARDPQGNIHEAPAGTVVPDGWEVVR